MTSNKEFGRAIEEYNVHEKIGVGGFASVYHATCSRTGWNVAIKQISKEQILERGLNERVRQEVSIHRTLDHPSILKLYTFFEDARFVYLVLELCTGGELQKALKGKPLPEEQCVRYVRQVVAGMLYLHSLSIMHRDLTLSNLLLAADGSLRIADFGLATQLTRPDDRHTTMCGTPNYMSPEVATRSSHGLESDVWSLGVMVYTMMVGRPPFHTHAVRATITRALLEQCDIPSHLSSECRDLISRCLQKNFRERIKLRDILHHPFLRNSETEPTSGRMCGNSIATSDSGLYTMTTSGNNLTSRPTTLHAIAEDEDSMCSPEISARHGSAFDAHKDNGHFHRPQCSSRSADDRMICSNEREKLPGMSWEGAALSDRDVKLTSAGYGDQYDNRCLSQRSSENVPDGRRGNDAEGVYRPHDPGGRIQNFPHSPPVKIKSHSRQESNPSNLAVIQTLKRKFTGLPPMHPITKLGGYGHPHMPPPSANSTDHLKRRPLHSAGYSERLELAVDPSHYENAQDLGEAYGEGRRRSRSHDRAFDRRVEKPQGRSLDRLDYKQKELFLDTPRDVNAENQNRLWQPSSSLTSRRSDDSLEKNSAVTKEHSCCRSAHHRNNCPKFQILNYDEEMKNPDQKGAASGPPYSCCNASTHRSGCELRRQEVNHLQFVQDYVNQNTFGHPSSSDLPSSDRQSNNLLDDITPVKFTPRLDMIPSVPSRGEAIEKDSVASQQVSSRKNSHADHVHIDSSHREPAPDSNRYRAASKPENGSLSQQCSPLSTRRLRPTRQTTKNAVLHILASGEVCIEFVKRKKRGELVMDACRISQDGMRVVLYSINDGAGGPPQDVPYAVPPGGAEAFFSFETLPKTYWKKYIYASRFVDVVKTKTPKITYYSQQAKCILMENSPDADFEATFYESGTKVLLSGGTIAVTEADGTKHSTSRSSSPHLPTSVLHFHNHAKTIHEHCLYLERVLADVEQKTGHDSFPLTIGRKPAAFSVESAQVPAKSDRPFSSQNKKRNEGEKENISPASVQSEMPRIHSVLNQVVGSYEASISSSASASRPALVARNFDSSQKENWTEKHKQQLPVTQRNDTKNVLQNTFVPGVGWMRQKDDGCVSVEFMDGSEVTVDCRVGAAAAVIYKSCSTDIAVPYGANATLPRHLRDKLSTVKNLMASLMQTKY
ncbi:serine/threonine-protein kinase PLK4 [Hyalella azteca]|uniref:Serine/threonine-protein kinase SAK n=1 Tax=Hyalella azteca TaxID=294128 RepID=A0A8B7NRK3_HYAAZ|nr:serine/threonine-protein kinase PLK4 [Hyalella azteca]